MLYTCDPPRFPFRHYTPELLCAWDADGLDFGRANSMRRDTIRRSEHRSTSGPLAKSEWISPRERDENETGVRRGNGGSKGLRMNVTINLSLSEEERNSRRCIHIGVSAREWKRVSSKIDAILRYHSCLFLALCLNLDPLIEIKYIRGMWEYKNGKYGEEPRERFRQTVSSKRDENGKSLLADVEHFLIVIDYPYYVFLIFLVH